MKHFDPFALDEANQCLWNAGRQITLAPKPYAVLKYLVENRGRLVSHDELLDALWPDTFVQPQVLRTYVLDLRKILGDDARQPRFIQSLPKRGYRFLAEVTEDAPATPSPTPTPLLAPGLVGRERELHELQDAAQQIGSSSRRLVFVSGEPGIGKSALLDVFAEQIRVSARGMVAVAQCVQGLGTTEDYYPVMDILGQLCAGSQGERVCSILAQRAPAWLPAGRGMDQLNGSAPVRLMPRLPGDLCAALEEISAETPLVLIFEDLHWADEATLHLLSAMARRRCEARVLLIATCQPHHDKLPQTLERMRQDLAVHKLCTEVVLRRLSLSSLAELVRGKLIQDALPPGLDRFVWEHSEGNPLFALSILEHLIAEGFLVRTKDQGWELRGHLEEMESALSPELARLIELEIGQLDAREQKLLEAGSLVEFAFPAWAVAAALEMDIAEAEQACNELTRKLYFLKRAGEDELPDGSRSGFYVFAHGLYREVLYHRQASAVRARRHVLIARRLGELFETRGTSMARAMAWHFEAADDWKAAIESLRSAARHAIAMQACAEARDLLEHAMRLAARHDRSGMLDSTGGLEREWAELCGSTSVA